MTNEQLYEWIYERSYIWTTETYEDLENSLKNARALIG